MSAPPSPSPRPLPMTVVGGFLGSGKTTLVSHWLREAGGQRIAVLVNDFGDLDIDAGLIAAVGSDVITLSNGCVCCQIGDDLAAALIAVLSAPAPFDAVVVEASGVSDPGRIAQYARADPALTPDGVIVLLDAATARRDAADPLLADTMLRQLGSADLLVVNKTDEVDAAEDARLDAWIAEAAPGVPTLRTTQARVPLAIISRLAPWDGGSVPHDAAPGPHRHDHAPAGDPRHGDVFESWSCRPARRFAVADLRDWFAGGLPGLLRLKGWVQAPDDGWIEVQFMGRRGTARPSSPPPGGEPAIVAIGIGGRLPRESLERAFEHS
ncbi:CobW family GTP-binding protein [Lichenibacterium minor]|nr:CobW family GTP-binding protein [Lichenibacterium minor]